MLPTFGELRGVSTEFIRENAQLIMQSSLIAYIRDAKLRGKLFDSGDTTGGTSSAILISSSIMADLFEHWLNFYPKEVRGHLGACESAVSSAAGPAGSLRDAWYKRHCLRKLLSSDLRRHKACNKLHEVVGLIRPAN